jgi:hypothetical protein
MTPAALIAEVKKLAEMQVDNIVCVRCLSNLKLSGDCTYCGGRRLIPIEDVNPRWIDSEFRFAFVDGRKPIWMRNGFYPLLMEDSSYRFWIVDGSAIIPVPSEIVDEAFRHRNVFEVFGSFTRRVFDWIYLTVNLVRQTDISYPKTSYAEPIQGTKIPRSQEQS